MKNNKLLAIGDILIVNVQSQMSGQIQLLSFVDDLTGIETNRNVQREFRLTVDDTFWTDWTDLTDENLSKSDSTFVDGFFTIQVRYTRIGSDDT